jgi:hypothetical protein
LREAKVRVIVQEPSVDRVADRPQAFYDLSWHTALDLDDARLAVDPWSGNSFHRRHTMVKDIGDGLQYGTDDLCTAGSSDRCANMVVAKKERWDHHRYARLPGSDGVDAAGTGVEAVEVVVVTKSEPFGDHESPVRI